MTQYLVLAARTQDDLATRGADVEQTFDTIKEAKKHAMYYTSEAYRVHSESFERLGYAQVLKNGKCVFDHFGF